MNILTKKEIFEAVGNRKLFGLKLIMKFVDIGWKAIKLPFKVIIGFMPPIIGNVLLAPAFYGALGFTFIWYMIEQHNLFNKLSKDIQNLVNMNEFEKNIWKSNENISNQYVSVNGLLDDLKIKINSNQSQI